MLLFLLSNFPAQAAPTSRDPQSRARGTLAPPPGGARAIGLYSPRVRRSTVMYLRLRLLELRAEGLERARAAIEHRLSVDELLADPVRPVQKAQRPARRSFHP